MRLLHLHWPHLLLRLARDRSSDPFPSEPIVLGGKPWMPGAVLDASLSALELGVRIGMPLGAAHRMAPEAIFLEPDRGVDEAALRAGLEILGGLSPGLVAETEADSPGFGRIEIQLDGLERLWGSEPQIVERAASLLAGILPGTPQAGIGGTRFVAAVAATVAGHGKSERPASWPRLERVEPRSDAEFLAPLPSSLLSRSPDVRGRLERFGLRTIGSVAELPRSAVVARFGPEGERIHARARGEETDPFKPRRAPERLAMSLPIDPPVSDVEGIRFVLHRVAAVFGDQLEARGAATSRVRLTLGLDRTFVSGDVPPTLLFDQHLPEPTSEGLAMERLLVARLEASTLPAPVSRLGMELLDVAPATGRQLTLFTPQAGRTGRLGWQLARLGLRFGEDHVGWVELDDVEAPLPEDRWRWRPQSEPDPVGSSASTASPPNGSPGTRRRAR
jgi:protein ImuB